MQQVLVLTDTGCEKACAREITNIVGMEPTINSNVLTVSCTVLDACVLAYNSKIARRVLIQITPPLKSLSDLEGKQPEHIEELFPENCTFKVEGEVLSHTTEGKAFDGPPTQELIETVGEWLHNTIDRKVSLSRPDVTIFTSMTPECTWIGADICGSLAKREWRIMLSRHSLKATVAAATSMYAGATEKDLILDPFGDDGTIAIETGLMLAGISPKKFVQRFPFQTFPVVSSVDWTAWKTDQSKERTMRRIEVYSETLKEMKAVRTNSKLAGIDKFLHSTKVSVGWISTKIKKNTVDKIITHVPQSGKALPEKKARQLIGEMFEQAQIVLSEKGTVTCASEKPEELIPVAEKYHFKLQKRRKVLMGKLLLEIITFTR